MDPYSSPYIAIMAVSIFFSIPSSPASLGEELWKQYKPYIPPVSISFSMFDLMSFHP